MTREYRRCPRCWPLPSDPLTLHIDGVCAVCAAKAANQERVDRALAALPTTARQIEFLLREVHTQKYLDRDGRWRHIGPGGSSRPGAKAPPILRGRNTKNIARILRRGKLKAQQLRAAGAAPPRKAEPLREARWTAKQARRRGTIEDFSRPSRGTAARRKALEQKTTTKRSAGRKTEALALLRSGYTQKQAAEQLGLDVRTIRRYQRER